MMTGCERWPAGGVTIQPKHIIDYSAPIEHRVRIEPAKLLRAALTLAVLPIIFGTIVIALWLPTRWGILVGAGLWVVLFGLIFFLIGIATLFCYIAACRHGAVPWVRPALLTALLLLANVPIAAGYIELAALWKVNFVNRSAVTINSLIIADPMGSRWQLGPIPPGGRMSRWFLPDGEGAITFSASQPGSGVNGTVEGYITSGMPGGAKTITINADGSYTSK
jgi:hypothetical protein